MEKYVILSIYSMLLFLIACATETITPDTGSIDLKVTIGPLCPTEPCNRDVKEITQIYESYSMVITESMTKKVILEQKLTYNGKNGAMKASNLAVGEYELNVKPETFFTKKSFPKTLKIEKDKVTSLEINIDTGIR